VSEARPGDVRVDWRIASAAAAALVVLFTFQNYVTPASVRAGASLARIFQLQIINWGSWLALSPWIFAAARRWRRSGRYTPGAFARQALIALAISVAQAALSGTLRWLGGISVFNELLDVVISSIVSTSASNLLRYSMISAAYHAVAYHHEVRDRDVRAARLEAALVQAKLDSLQGRLQPHFLFNTLNSIAALIRDQPEAAEQMLGSLSELLRASLHAEPGREVTLESELDLVRQYVSIQQMRFSDRLTVTIDVAPDALSAQVPHLLLQPLVENAIRHGIAPREAPGHVRIAAGRSGDRLRLQVEDDGLGLGETRPSTAGAGLGLSATEARLRHLYGGGASLKVASRAPTGVIATIDLPFHTTPAQPAPAAAAV